MAHLLDRRWEGVEAAPSRRERRSGHYAPYVPDPLMTRPLVLAPELGYRAATVEAAVRGLALGPGAKGLEGLARFLLRSEAIASSRIEGLEVSSQQVALAEFAQVESELGEHPAVRGFSENARLVANNINALQRAVTSLAPTAEVTVADVAGLQRSLLPDYSTPGLRSAQNWLGGSMWHPLDAEFVPPPEGEVERLMADLVGYLNGGLHAPLIQAGLVHAQFETIHPFTDGNGRVGRALIHLVLTRRGLTPAAVLPISLVLLTRADVYVRGLTSYRYTGAPEGPAARDGVGEWLEVFLDAVEVATEQAAQFVTDLQHLRQEWAERLDGDRRARGVRARPRKDSAVARLLDLLPEAPLVTARSVQRLLGVSFPAARNAVEELATSGILSRKQVERGTTGYLAREVFDLLTVTERRLASTRWDTRESPPARPAPAAPRA